MESNQIHKAVNWNERDDYTQVFWEQNVKQMWTDTEIPVAKDLRSWELLTPEEKSTFKRVLGGLTLLDTKQGNEGMPFIMEHVNDLQKKAVLSFMGMMEQIHAKSYSTIFTTLAFKEEIDEVFKWIEEDKRLQYKAERISHYYRNIDSDKELYMAMVASVFLESYLFYSGFFYPLYLAGQGKMVSSGEIISLILRDESIHGVFVGLLAQEVFESLNSQEQDEVRKETYILLEDLMSNELSYSEEVYGNIGLDCEVKNFVKYNANKALMNLGLEGIYEVGDVNPIVLNGLSTETRTHDFFSTKGSGYQKGIVEELRDEDFKFDFMEEVK